MGRRYREGKIGAWAAAPFSFLENTDETRGRYPSGIAVFAGAGLTSPISRTKKGAPQAYSGFFVALRFAMDGGPGPQAPFRHPWTLPRPKKQSTGLFFAPAPPGPAFRVPSLAPKGAPVGRPFWLTTIKKIFLAFLWRDLNPRDFCSIGNISHSCRMLRWRNRSENDAVLASVF